MAKVMSEMCASSGRPSSRGAGGSVVCAFVMLVTADGVLHFVHERHLGYMSEGGLFLQ